MFRNKIEHKIVTVGQLQTILQNIKLSESQPRVVFTNGCFDLVHRGHVDYLSQARDLGDVLIVGVNSDASVRRLKGNGRPISHQESRLWVLAAFEFVDYVVVFDEDTPFQLIQSIKPDILVKGADYKHENVVGADLVESYGGKVVLIDLVPNESTTRLVNLMKLS